MWSDGEGGTEEADEREEPEQDEEDGGLEMVNNT
jgi:hypothetical protein